MKIKVCGLNDPVNIESLAYLPIDFMGFIFYKKSPRHVRDGNFRTWIAGSKNVFGKVKRVGVFVNAEIEEILNKVHDFELDYVQLHGEESPEYCREIESFWAASTLRRARFIKAFAVDADFDFARTRAYEGICSLFLFDTKTPQHGGSGVRFDWQLLEKYRGHTPFLLSGGIDEGDAMAIKALDFPQLYGVDVNSRFEIKPGVKDVDKVKRFLEALEM
ncbi:MAG TPA: phosphoribosylanthranilate isomerase [Saprospiraceae bacterium]|nr:phosphoribosylanthranilate isomerase [Saprospiraceae bacterium]HMP13402.1 phosphoribosylanthranilate isomerase [Saprospiraceae bacterium]